MAPNVQVFAAHCIGGRYFGIFHERLIAQGSSRACRLEGLQSEGSNGGVNGDTGGASAAVSTDDEGQVLSVAASD